MPTTHKGWGREVLRWQGNLVPPFSAQPWDPTCLGSPLHKSQGPINDVSFGEGSLQGPTKRIPSNSLIASHGKSEARDALLSTAS